MFKVGDYLADDKTYAEAAEWCTQGQKYTIKDRVIVEIIKPDLTNDEQNEIIRQTRENLYRQNTDILTLEKLRRQAIGNWTIADEEQYVAKIKSESEKIVTENAYIKE